MTKRYIALIALAIGSAASAQAYHSVKGYTRSDGTYVAPHYQTNPNSTSSDNWSTRGNTNPFTGKAGTVDPYGSSSYGSSYQTPSSTDDSEQPQ